MRGKESLGVEKMNTHQLRRYRHGLKPRARYKLLSVALNERQDALDKLGFDDYGSYLRSALWSAIRRRVYVRADGRCEACGEQPPENIHHWSYSVATLQGEQLKHLEAVCKPCHDQFHEVPAPVEKQRTAKQKSNDAWRALVRSGGVVAQPRDMTPRLVKDGSR